ncbi:hypothetical protein HPP92_001624 [Vanilla planifolia]|uniref:Auxin-responsive protein n=1 Tax=Vanilla planifolia TaxID=51239 RepID=A0A835RUB8_VANPL|nr:hypothetical protein HPP92_001624 [Vanilla planifolia]
MRFHHLPRRNTASQGKEVLGMERSRHIGGFLLHSLKDTELRLGLPGTGEQSLQESREEKLLHSEIGWLPIQSHWKNGFETRKEIAKVGSVYVKVSMDGVPYSRKIDVVMYKGYKELIEAMKDLFKCFPIDKAAGKESCNSDATDFVFAYEDQDGDWMLIGDVPWGIFISTCRRLRITRRFEARGFRSK